MFAWLRPKDRLDDTDVTTGLRMLLYEGMYSQVLVVLTTGAFLVAFALHLGASNKVIGLLAAIGPISQILQIPSIFLVERTGLRKALTLSTAFVARAFWLVIAAIPWVLPDSLKLPVFLFSLFGFFALSAMGGCAYGSWIRDLVPEKSMGTFFAKRLAYATAIGAGLSFAAGVGIDVYKRHFENELGAYSILFTIAAIAGFLGVGVLFRAPEPKMPETLHRSVRSVLAEPFRDLNFRKLLIFLGWWNFAANFAGPFFAVYMIDRLKLNMTWVLGLSLVSQGMNVLFFGVWGRLADRFTNKSVLAASAPLFFLTFIMWPFTAMPAWSFLSIPLLLVIHALGGISTAGVAISANNLALKGAPFGKSTSYLAMTALISGMAGTVAPLIAGVAADWFEPQHLSVALQWNMENSTLPAVDFHTVDLRGLDFVFLAAFVLGLQAVHRLLAIREEGEVKEDVVLRQLYSEMRKSVSRQVSTVAGMRQLSSFPLGKLRTVLRLQPADTPQPPELATASSGASED
ncbi:MAG: MFS transporter [Candidatus Hydrogenedentes bacterium]|nr:MFS transporter [Candidatus Hydrogenedentota bacterium]